MHDASALRTASRTRASTSQKYHDRKLGITGGYVFRAKLMVAMAVLQALLSISGNRSAVQEDMMLNPVLQAVQLLNILLTDGFGLLFCATFLTMRQNNWERALAAVRRCTRRLFAGSDSEARPPASAMEMERSERSGPGAATTTEGGTGSGEEKQRTTESSLVGDEVKD